MKRKHNHNQQPDDPEVFPLRLYRPDDTPDGPQAPEYDLDEEEEAQIEAFWAGRNHAMRVSARVAA